MATKILKVDLSPLKAQELLEQKIEDAVTFSDAYDLGDGKYLFITAYERFYMRNNSVTGLLVICENTTGQTQIKLSNTGGAIGAFLSDLGAGKSFITDVEQLFKPYLITSEEK